MTVIDSSVVIAVLRGEPTKGSWADRLDGAALSAVNLAEVIAHGVRSGLSADEVGGDVADLKITVHPFDEAAAAATGTLIASTQRLGLSLGDRACLALAHRLGARVLTADRVWARLDIGIPIDVIR